MNSYKNLIRLLLGPRACWVATGAVTSTGQPLRARSVFGATWGPHNLTKFPLLTCKKMPLRLIAEELGFFLRGESHIRTLQARNVHIWDEWADPDGELGPVYGVQWRTWPGRDGSTVDQMARLIDGILRVKENPSDRVGRRLLLSAWNPGDLHAQKLPPCHFAAQWSVRPAGTLDCLVHMRSADLFLGVPFNLASYALLTMLLAHVTDLQAGKLSFTFGDLHLYENHIGQAHELLQRNTHPLPVLVIKGPVDALLRDLDVASLELVGYQNEPALPGEVAI